MSLTFHTLRAGTVGTGEAATEALLIGLALFAGGGVIRPVAQERRAVGQG